MEKRLALLSVILLVLGFNGIAMATPVSYNGSMYEVVLVPGINWTAAQPDIDTRLGSGWHLATITSQGEQDFVAGLLASYGETEFWAGGKQPSGQSDPREGWEWVTGETWDYTAWATDYAIEPNDWNGQDEIYLALDNRWARYWTWNDALDTENVGGYVAEAPVPEPATVLLLGSGLVGLAGFRRKLKNRRP